MPHSTQTSHGPEVFFVTHRRSILSKKEQYKRLSVATIDIDLRSNALRMKPFMDFCRQPSCSAQGKGRFPVIASKPNLSDRVGRGIIRGSLNIFHIHDKGA